MSAFERPGLYPYHAEAETTTLPTVAESAGYIPNTIADPGVANALGKSSGRWAQYLDLVSFRLGTIIDPNIPYLERGIALTYPLASGVANLTPATTPTIITDGLYLAIDESLLSVAGLNPATFAINSRTWIYVTPPTSPGGYPAIRVDTVALGTPAAPVGTEITVGGVDTDGSNVTANVAGDAGSLLTLDTPIGLLGNQTMLFASGNTASNLVQFANNGAGYAIEITGSGFADVMDAERFVGLGNGNTLPTMTLAPSAGAASLHITDAGGALDDEAALYITQASGRGIYIDSTASSTDVAVVHTAATGYGYTCSTASANAALLISQSYAGGPALEGAAYFRGNDANVGEAIRAESRWNTSAAITAETTNSANFDTPAILGQGGLTSGSGIHGFAGGNGYGVIVEGDANNPPARGSLRIVPQLNDATTGQIGDVEFRSDTGEARLYTQQGGSSGWRSVHTSSRGYVWAFGAKQSGGPISGGTTGWIGDATIYPVQTGNVLVTVTGTLDFQSVHDAAEINLRESSGTVIAVSRVVSSDGSGIGDGQTLTFSVQGIYTLPDTTSRTFQVLIDSTTGAFDYDHVIVSVQGIQSP